MAKRIGIDLLIWVLASAVCLLWRFATAKAELMEYVFLAAILAVTWVIVGTILQLYRSYKIAWYWQSALSCLLTGAALMTGCYYLLPVLPLGVSVNVAMWLVGAVTVTDMVVILMEHYWKYAQNMTIPLMEIEQRTNAKVSREDEMRSPQSIETIHQAVTSITTEEDYQLLVEKAHINNRQTKIIADKTGSPFCNCRITSTALWWI